MGRMTRAKAAEVAEKLHIDEDAVLEIPGDGALDLKITTPKKDERTPLGEIAPNSGGSKEEDSEVAELKKSTRGRKTGKKGRKGKQNTEDSGASTATELDGPDDEAPQVVKDNRVASQSPADDSAASSLDEGVQSSERYSICCFLHDSELQSDQSRAARLAPRQIARKGQLWEENETVECSKDELVAPSLVEPCGSVMDSSANEHSEEANEAQQTALDAPASPLPSAMPNVVKSLRKDTPAMRSTSNKENVEPLEATPSTRVGMTHRRVSTYDALEEAVVNGGSSPAGSTHSVNQAFPAPEPQRSPAQSTRTNDIASPKLDKHSLPIAPVEVTESAANQVAKMKVPVVEEAELKEEQPKKKAAKPAPVVRTTKASQARISMAHQDKNNANNTMRPRPSSISGKPADRLSKSTSAAPRVPSGSKQLGASTTSESDQPKEKKEAVIPHSKPRPISISFPTPPPPPKSKKAPTSSTFQLPGEAVAAKLKAAREARLAKEAEAAQKREHTKDEPRKPAFKARPVPASLKQAPSVRPTNASRARESLKSSARPGAATSAVGAHRRASSVATATRTSSIAPKTAALKPSGSEQPINVAKRPSTAMAISSGTRSSMPPAETTAQRVPSKGPAKGKEVFNRAAISKAAAEKERKEKEEAAKKARAAAAERGRQLSKEWAEKQRLKKLGFKPEAKKHDSVQSLDGREVAAASMTGGEEGVQAEAAVAESA
ncbi:nucleolar and coiled-body phosphoprotein 1-like [Teratosphaeria destructans]|uniref:Nucleolar and coiled-body phosphoprotein 1-like n=1 Tax=Teratosphaeria destructans TaxID=418781 RepID=A0A9W7SIC5_9PEZI|nr:nucleolar and coiled-body phosphoprotein 1-like [Teratosphaeria destructans]